MALACPLPVTLFSAAIVSRGYPGLGPTGVAGALCEALQANALQSLAYSAPATLQHLQHLLASRVHMHRRRGASGRDHARGFGSVASVASVAKSEYIYKSIAYAATPSATVAAAIAQGVAALACPVGSEAPEAIKYPRIFKGLGAAGRSAAGIARFGVFGARAPGRPAAGAPASGATRRGLDLGETGRFRPSSPVPLSPAGEECERYQGRTPQDRLTVRVNRGPASRRKAAPPSRRDPTPRLRPAPSSPAPFGAPVGALRVFSAGGGENRDRPEVGARGVGARGQGAAKTCGLVKAGSGEFRHG